MQEHAYIIRTMSLEELDIAVEWAAREGWNPGLHDAGCFHAADPEGFLVGMLGSEPIATISAVKYGDSFGFMGFYIVKPEYRGAGYGMKIWQAAMARLTGRNIGLDGVVAQQDNYRRSGFKLAYRNIRYQGTGGKPVAADGRIVPLSAVPFESLSAYDQPFFPDCREDFLHCWSRLPDSAVLCILHDGELAGYGVLRACRIGYKIGPLFADDAALAEALFMALQAQAPENAAIFLDTPETNPAAIELAQRHGMSVSFETARMYTGTVPDLPMQRLFGVTTFELG
ncbi:MAG: GNAT family N-acetyltransferase [Gallionella sp.]|jgi:ribosomal protein S18 acetylase RimI-like enzyme|nr:GNAT family N-acetyltransferase [Gallionella sp.]MCK9354184.1 GNAT family N-acetyltransferase [Gallionella sp.]